MALIIRQPTANQSPDATLGGTAVTTPTNTGHASTVTSVSGADNAEKSARWFSFQAVSGTKTAITLKIDHTSSGSLSGGGSNQFILDYSTNGGGAWTNAVTRTNFTAPEGPTTFSVALSAAQDISQVQVRADYLVGGAEVGDSASITATIANIKLEVTVRDEASPIVII